MINDAVDGKVQFDEQFAKSVLREVFHVERSAKRWRNILGYLTLPIGFLPWIGALAEKAVGEAAGLVIETRMKQKHKWFYMLSEIVEAADKGAEQQGGGDKDKSRASP